MEKDSIRDLGDNTLDDPRVEEDIVNEFNRNPKATVERMLLLSCNSTNTSSRRAFLKRSKSHLRSEATTSYVAKFLRYNPKLLPTNVGIILGSPDPESLSILSHYANEFSFYTMPLDIALRLFLGHFVPPRESQQLDRILEAFAKVYYSHNSQQYNSVDQIHIISFAAIILQSTKTLPTTSVMEKASFKTYVKGCIEEKPCLPSDDVIDSIYNSIMNNDIRPLQRKEPVAAHSFEVEVEFKHKSIGLTLETALDGTSCAVRIAPAQHPDLEGWIITSVGDISTEGLMYELTLWLIKSSALRPITLRFCEPSLYFRRTEFRLE